MKYFLFVLFLSSQAFGQKYEGNQIDIDQILSNINAFSAYYMNADFEGMANSYTADGKIFPAGEEIIQGTKAIKERWTLPEGVKILHHKAKPEEIRIVGNYAYDYGYYEGKTARTNGETSSWRGKYVIVWEKEGKDWKIYLDIWNRVN